MITIECECGEKYFADEQHIGGRIQCKKCHRLLPIQRSASPSNADFLDGLTESVIGAKEHSSGTIPPAANPPSSRVPRFVALIPLVILLLVLLFFNLSRRESPREAFTPPKSTLGAPEQDSVRRAGHAPGPVEHQIPLSGSPRSLNTSSKPVRAKTSRKEFRPHNPANDEPENPNVLPLGAAPFDYDVREGNSTLTVDNGTTADALVRVIRVSYPTESIRNFFIPANEKYTAEQIPAGSYMLRVAFGKDWNSDTRKFNYRQSFSETDKFVVTETTWNEPDPEGYIKHTEASQMSITLHKVPFGNFESHQITEEDFWR